MAGSLTTGPNLGHQHGQRTTSSPGAAKLVLLGADTRFASAQSREGQRHPLTSGWQSSSSNRPATEAAVEADAGVSPTTRDAVLDAHLAICIAKAKLDA